MNKYYNYFAQIENFEEEINPLHLIQETLFGNRDFNYLGFLKLVITSGGFNSFIIFDLNKYINYSFDDENYSYDFDSLEEGFPQHERVNKFFNYNNNKFNSEV